MTIIITILASLLVFGAVVAVHEFGHFTAAKLSGIQVNEFAIGMGPALWKKIAGGTQYTLRLLPVGGYVAMEGEGSPESNQAERAGEDQPPAWENPIPPEERTGIPFPQAAIWKRAATMAAGPLMNFVLGFVVLAGVIGLGSDPIVSRVLYQIEEGALCGQTGLAAGDEIVAVNGRRCFVANDILYELARTQDARADFTVRRDGQLVELPDVRFDTYTDQDGNARMDIGFTVYALEKTPANVLKESLNYELYYGRIIFTSLADLLEMLVLITVNLGIFNLLPIPALDGGRLVFLAAEAVLRRPVSERLQETLTLATFLLLFGLMIFATYNDVIRLFTGGF